ncbi:CHASE4 domain-containing protein [Geobacter sp.]|uniref:sensor histidine kinase n=1 Tax=Geobacter sp. TaxID=46610 RepID=UPI00262E9CD7|nr:CHASE4 domain-containing protein [Geobacter sp.]
MRATGNKTKLIGLLATALVVGLAFLLYDDFNYLGTLQKERMAEKETLFDQVVAMRSDPIRHLVMDYSFWDDMVKFVYAPDPLWAEVNIDSSFASYRYSALWIYRADGTLAYSVQRDGTRIGHGAPSPAPEGWIKPLFAGKEEFPRFFVATPQGVMELHGAVIHSPRDGDRRGKRHGFLVAGVLWDDASLAELARLTRSTLTLRPPGAPPAGAPPDPRNGVITFARPLAGIDGKPVATVVVRMAAPDIRQLVREMDNNALIGTALMAVLAILVVFVLVSRQRLKNANANLDAAQQTAQMGSWQREFESGDTSWSENLYRIFGLAAKETVPGPEQLDQIFDEFYRGDAARHELGRPGLGLAICRRIVANHQGRIWAESAGKGKGTTIRFTLPRALTETDTISDKEPAYV